MAVPPRPHPPASEKSIETAIRSLIQRRGGKVVKQVMTGYGVAGTPDLLGSYRGRALALEVKRPGGTVTQLQLEQLSLWELAGAAAAVVHSVQEVSDVLARIDTEAERCTGAH